RSVVTTTFFGSDQGSKTAAVLRSFAASCQRAGVDPFSWLKDVLTPIPSHPISRIAELLPHNCLPSRAVNPIRRRSRLATPAGALLAAAAEVACSWAPHHKAAR